VNPYPRPPSWAAAIRTIAVTGTDGKSSTTRYCAAGLSAATGGAVARMTTVDAGIEVGVSDELGGPPDEHDGFLAMMAEHQRRGGTLAAIEATSATLALGFARAWPMTVGVFTNLGHDHLRGHGSFEHYLAAKAQLFVALRPGGAAVLNAGDPHSALIAEVVPAGVRTLWFAGPGLARDALVAEPDVQVATVELGWDGLALRLDARAGLGVPDRVCLATPARFQAGNAAAALLACVALGVDGHAAAAGIARCPPPPGRFEVITRSSAPSRPARVHPSPPSGPAHHPRVVVDYAHTPEALRAALASARALAPTRLIVVFGAGGDGDRRKRPELGAEASVADAIWLTSDNPRGEDPARIVEDIAAGIATGVAVQVELDRAAAITRAIAGAEPGDLVVVAGKGHERGQARGGQVWAFSDQQVARAALDGDLERMGSQRS
jgi:UDP-N-acetylmuramyl tripeptide synthase